MGYLDLFCNKKCLPKEGSLVVKTAGLLNSTAYLAGYGSSSDAFIFGQRLGSYGYDKQTIDEVMRVMEAVPAYSINGRYEPTEILEAVVYDAEHAWLGMRGFTRWNTHLKKELEEHEDTLIPQKDWNLQLLDMLQRTAFKTEYGRSIFEKRRLDNLKQTLESI